MSEKREPTSGLEPLTPAPVTSLLADVLVRPTASGFRLVYGVFGGCSKMECPLRTGLYQPVAERVAVRLLL
jgi:hypothetical protein